MKESFSNVDYQLRNDCNCSEDVAMVSQIMPENLFQATPVLESLVDCFLSIADSLLHELCQIRICDMSGAFDMERSLSNVSIVSFNTLVLR